LGQLGLLAVRWVDESEKIHENSRGSVKEVYLQTQYLLLIFFFASGTKKGNKRLPEVPNAVKS
jgi:hypothetical protein